MDKLCPKIALVPKQASRRWPPGSMARSISLQKDHSTVWTGPWVSSADMPIWTGLCLAVCGYPRTCTNCRMVIPQWSSPVHGPRWLSSHRLIRAIVWFGVKSKIQKSEDTKYDKSPTSKVKCLHDLEI